MELLIKGARVVDSARTLDKTADIAVKDGLIAKVGENLKAPNGARTIDAHGLVAFPGFIDMHTHRRPVSYTHLTLPTIYSV